MFSASSSSDGKSLRPIAVLFLASTAAAVVVTIAGVAALAHSTDVGRIRELDLYRVVRLILEEKANLNPLAALPSVLSLPFELRDPATLLRFTALTLATMMLCFWIVAVVLTPFVLLLRKISPECSSPASAWFWRCVYPIAVLAGFATPALHAVVRDVSTGGRTAIWAETVALATGGGVVLLAILRDAARIRRLVWASGICGLIITGVIWTGALALASHAQGPIARPIPAPGSPNVLLVSIDSLRHDHLHCYGYPRETSPTIDQLAREGTLFRTVVSPSSWTLPAHLTLMTSIPPEAHGVVNDGLRLRHDAIFLADVFWQAGYDTAGFVSAPYLDAAYGFSQGFGLYDDYTVPKITQAGSHQGVTSPTLFRIVSSYFDQWEAGGRQRPFFVFMHMWDVHYDYIPPPPYNTMFDPDYRGTITGENYEYGDQVHAGMDPRDLQHIIALYDGEIRYTDSYLGHVLDRLRALGVLDNTLVVVTADHGDEFYEHGNKGHGKMLYDESVLIPLVIRFPKSVPSGRSIDGQVRLMDVAPTILSLAGLSRPAGFGGALNDQRSAKDLSPWIVAEPASSPPSLVAFGDLQRVFAPRQIASVRTETLKFIESLQHQGQDELYDLSADPGEQHNIIERDVTSEATLRREVAGWRTAQRADASGAEKIELSEEHKERLRALGYMH